MSIVLSEHLSLLVGAPTGLQKLRGLILQLAVRGKLVSQDAKDEPATELIKRIGHERARLVAEGTCRKMKPMPVLLEGELPFSVPDSWRWARLGDLLLGINSGGTPSKHNPSFWNGDIPWASVKDLGFGTPLTFTQDRITAAGLEAGSFLATAGSILICTRMGLGKIGEAKIDVAINQDLKAIRLSEELDKQYFIYFFRTLSIRGSGMTVSGIKQDELLQFMVPVPPIAEQRRIVAEVCKLMSACDLLEAEQANAEEAHSKLVANLLQTLAQSTDAADISTNWQISREHFDTLLTTVSSLDVLKQTIVQLAYSGRLTKSDSSQWESAKLVEVTEAIADIDHKMPKAVSEGVIFLSAKDLKDNGTLDFSQPKYISREDFERLSRRICPRRGDIIYSRIGARLGKARLVEVDTEFLVSYSCCVIRPNPEKINRQYLAKFLDSRLALDQAHLGKQSIGVPDLGLGVIKAFELPVPSLAEQQQIVNIIDELMVLCDRLKVDLAESRSRQTTLAVTLIEAALEAV